MDKLIKELNDEKYGVSPKKAIKIMNQINKYSISSYEALKILREKGINALEIYLVKMELNSRKVS